MTWSEFREFVCENASRQGLITFKENSKIGLMLKECENWGITAEGYCFAWDELNFRFEKDGRCAGFSCKVEKETLVSIENRLREAIYSFMFSKIEAIHMGF